MSRLEDLWYSREPGSSALNAPLGLAALGYGAGVSIRNALFARGLLASKAIEGARIVSVGNLTVGGAGKTPAVIYLAQWASRVGRTVAVLTRGYGRASTAPMSFGEAQGLPSVEQAGDEPVLIARRCPSARIFVGADRAKQGAAARATGADFLLMDDGFQHRRLARDVNIVVIDEAVGFGNGRLLPRGPLREPLSALARADLIWLRESSSFKAALPPFSQPVIRTRYEIGALVGPDQVSHNPRALEGREVIALAAIARGSRFPATLEALGMKVVERRLFPDHHLFTLADLAELSATSARLQAPVVTTEKDAVRLPADFPSWVARLEVRIVEGYETLQALLAL